MSKNNEDFGLGDWNEELGGNNNNNKNTENRDLFMRLQDGSNRIRILTRPAKYWHHRYKEFKDDPGFGDKVMCSRRSKDHIPGECPLCDDGVPRVRRWFIGVIDRRTQTYKILDMSKTAYQGVQNLVRDDDWGDPLQYDVDIVVNKSAGAKGYYTVVPKPAKPLSQADKDIKQNNVDLEDLKRRAEPPTVERVLKRISFIQKKMAEKRGPAENKKQQNQLKNAPEHNQYDFSQEQ